MSFDHPKCKAFSTASYWIVWLALFLGAFIFLGFSIWKAVSV